MTAVLTRSVAALGPDPRARRWWITALACVVALPVLLVLGVGIGSIPIPPSDVLAALTHRSTDPVTTAIVGELRLPRALVAMTAGGMLGLAGALLQTVLTNPLVEPTLGGVSPGAVLALVGALFEAITALLLLTHNRQLGAVLLFTVGSLEAHT